MSKLDVIEVQILNLQNQGAHLPSIEPNPKVLSLVGLGSIVGEERKVSNFLPARFWRSEPWLCAHVHMLAVRAHADTRRVMGARDLVGREPLARSRSANYGWHEPISWGRIFGHLWVGCGFGFGLREFQRVLFEGGTGAAYCSRPRYGTRWHHAATAANVAFLRPAISARIILASAARSASDMSATWPLIVFSFVSLSTVSGFKF